MPNTVNISNSANFYVYPVDFWAHGVFCRRESPAFSQPPPSIASVSLPQDVAQLLSSFPAVTNKDAVQFAASDPPHSVQHHIVTTGPPVFARARRLEPEKLAATKNKHLLPPYSCHSTPPLAQSFNQPPAFSQLPPSIASVSLPQDVAQFIAPIFLPTYMLSYSILRTACPTLIDLLLVNECRLCIF